MFNRSVNKVVLVGNLGKDPEIKYMQGGGVIANLTLATSESWKDKQTGEKKEKTEWHQLTVFNRLGEMCGEYLKKGAKIYIEGKLETSKWQGQDGQDRYSTKIIVDEIQIMDRSDNQNQGQAQGANQYNTPQQNGPAHHNPPAQQSWGNAPQQNGPAYNNQPVQNNGPAHKPQNNGPRYQGR